MAAASSSWCRLAGQQILRKICISRHTSNSYLHLSCRTLSQESDSRDVKEKDPSHFFLLPDVQERLYKISGFDLYKVFRPRQMNTDAPKYKLLTDEQLQELQQDAVQRGLERLQMPPYLKAREEVIQVISDDHEIEGFDTSNYVFTDITFGIPDQSRYIVIREPTGTLRHASAEERRRMCQLFNPRTGRMMFTPAMFEEEHLERILEDERYEYVLDRACLQFEPDDHDFIRVCHRTFEHVASTGQFEALRSTRHFGSMAFYFAFNSHIGKLLTYLITCDQVDDAADLIGIYHTIHPDSKSAILCKEQNVSDPVAVIKAYISSGEAEESAMVELALQSHLDTQNFEEAES